MNYRAERYTEKFPFRYIVETPKYFIYTTNIRHYVKLLQQIKRKGLTELSHSQVLKLNISSFTCVKRG